MTTAKGLRQLGSGGQRTGNTLFGGTGNDVLRANNKTSGNTTLQDGTGNDHMFTQGNESMDATAVNAHTVHGGGSVNDVLKLCHKIHFLIC